VLEPTKLLKMISMKSKAENPTELDKIQHESRIRRVLASNRLVSGDSDLVENLFDEGAFQHFRKGSEIITQGCADNHVYFLISGKVDVLINGSVRDEKAAPDTVGELAAHKPFKPRTATVRAATDLEVLRVECKQFASLVDGDSEMERRLGDLTGEMLHARLADNVEPKGKLSTDWVTMSVLVGAGCWLILAVILKTQFGFSFGVSALIGAIFGAMASIFLLMNNPKFFYRSMFRLTLLAGLGYATFGGIVVAGGTRLEILPGTSGDLGSYIITLIFVFLICMLCVWKDKSS
jgi:hypothetical protein